MMNERILEKNKRLSRSQLWNLQTKAYTQYGVEAWSKQGVPSYITSNPYTAKCYAHVVLGYLRDCIAEGKLNFSFPLYILDLGAGTGRFAYLFIKELLEFLKEKPFSQLKICYVMTDIAESNMVFWRKHALLQPYFEKGILDCAFYHHSQTAPLKLMLQQHVLSKETLKNPLVLVANYFFDTIPQDLFRIHDGLLEEGQVTLFANKSSLSLDDPDIIRHLTSKYSYVPIADPENYYPQTVLNQLLEIYRQKFDGNSFLFPVGAFEALENFIDLSGSRLLLLAGDQGVCTEKQVKQWGEPQIALHASFSLAVSYHLIGMFFNQIKGQALMTSFSDPLFVIMAGVIGKGWKTQFPETSLAFKSHIDAFESVDYWKLVSAVKEKWKTPPLDYVCLLIKLGNWDPICLHTFYSCIKSALPKAESKEKERLFQLIDCVWEKFYPVAAGEGDFIFNLAVLLLEMECYEKALVYFERSMQITGKNSAALKNMEHCYKALGNHKAALQCSQSEED